jgi:hypothetical protein
VKIFVQKMVIGLLILVILGGKLILHGFFPQAGWILPFFIPNDPLKLIGYALVLSAAVELAYMLYTDGPDEALNPLLVGLAAAALLVLSRLKGGPVTWEIGLTILVISVAVVLLFFIRSAYLPTPSDQKPIKGELRRIENRSDRVESVLQARIVSLERQLEEANERDRETALQRAWWRRLIRRIRRSPTSEGDELGAQGQDT